MTMNPRGASNPALHEFSCALSITRQAEDGRPDIKELCPGAATMATCSLRMRRLSPLPKHVAISSALTQTHFSEASLAAAVSLQHLGCPVLGGWFRMVQAAVCLPGQNVMFVDGNAIQTRVLCEPINHLQSFFLFSFMS